MKKSIYVFACILLSFFSFIACNNQKNTDTSKENTKKIVYTTFFPVTDAAKRIIGDKMEILPILKANEEPHSFELKINDMKDIKNADLIIYNGANMETFIDDLKGVVKDDSKFLDLSQGLVLLTSNDELQNKDDVNPHTWLSIKNIMVELDTIYQKVSDIDKENEPFYKKNLEKALAEFKGLDEKFENTLSKIDDDKRYFVVSHAAFNYLANDYNLKQVAVTGISPEDEPTAKQLKTIADFVKKHNISTIFFEGTATPKVAHTLAENTGAKTATLYTMESLSKEEMDMGYLKLMQMNLDALTKSFNE